MVDKKEKEGRRLLVPGGQDIILTPETFNSNRAYQRLCLGYSLQASDFVDPNMWKTYFYAIPKLTEGCVTVGGAEGNGKSL